MMRSPLENRPLETDLRRKQLRSTNCKSRLRQRVAKDKKERLLVGEQVAAAIKRAMV
jgi:hypothetical protein